MVFLVVGLGNPGLRYRKNRHNAGFMAVERVAGKTGIEISKTDFGGTYGSGFHGETKLIVFKPETYMNNSGEPVRKIMNFYGIEKENLVVAHDEVDLPVGRIQVKLSGGSAGHNGIKSVAASVGNEFARVRIGVGKPAPGGMDVADYVLADFDGSEMETVAQSIDTAAAAVCEIVSDGVAEAMNRHNQILENKN